MGEMQVKTKKVVRRRLNLKRVFLLALFICLLVFAGKELFKVDVSNITVRGNEFVGDGTIIKLAGLNSDTSFLGLNTREACKKVTELPLIEACKIKRGFDFKLTIEVIENSPVFYYSSINKLVLSNGDKLENANSFGVPTLINNVPEKILDKFIAGLADVKGDIIRSISEIEYKPSANSDGTFIDEERFMLSMNDGNIIYINNKNLYVLDYYDKIFASLGDKKGYYNFDSNFSNYWFEEFSS